MRLRTDPAVDRESCKVRDVLAHEQILADHSPAADFRGTLDRSMSLRVVMAEKIFPRHPLGICACHAGYVFIPRERRCVGTGTLAIYEIKDLHLSGAAAGSNPP